MNPNEIAKRPPIRHTIAEMKEILNAIEQGKQIQWYDSDTNTWRDFDFNHDNPNFNFEHRIKSDEPQKKWRPFKDTAELFAHNNGSNFLWLKDITKNKAECFRRLVTLYSESTIAFDTDSEFTMEGLLESFTFVDGTPCGVEEDA